MKIRIHHGMNTRDALKIAKLLGCTVEHDGGERVVSHPALRDRMRTRAARRRKDSCRALTGLLLKVVRLRRC